MLGIQARASCMRGEYSTKMSYTPQVLDNTPQVLDNFFCPFCKHQGSVSGNNGKTIREKPDP